LVTTPQISAKAIVEHYRDVLIAAITSVDRHVVDVRAHESWTKVKIHAIPLRRFMGRGTEGIQKLRAEIEAENPGVVIPRAVRWLGNPRRIKERYRSGDIQKSSAVFVVKNPDIAKDILKRGSVFVGGSKYVVEPFVDDGPDSLCAKCNAWGHIQEKCKATTPRCGLCAEAHFTAEHRCIFPGCTALGGRDCAHGQKLKCANCGEKHPAATTSCKARREAIARAREAGSPRGSERHPRRTATPEDSSAEGEAVATVEESLEPHLSVAPSLDNAKGDSMDEDTESPLDDAAGDTMDEDIEPPTKDTAPPLVEEGTTAPSEAITNPVL
jgi:hypothetical protein